MQAEIRRLIGVGIFISLLGTAHKTFAKDGLQLDFTIGTRLRSVSEDGGATAQDEGGSVFTNLGFTLNSETKTQKLLLDMQTGVPLFQENGDTINSDFALVNPSLLAMYSIENRQTRLSFQSTYRQSDVSSSTFLVDAQGNDVATGVGKRTLNSNTLNLELWRENPVSATLNARYSRDTFDDANPNLSDSTAVGLNGRLNFELSQVATLFAFTNWQEIDQDLSTSSDSTTSSYGLGLTYELSSVTTVSTQLSFDESQTDTTNNSGLGYRLTWDRVVPNGAYNARLSRTETSSGTRGQLSLRRVLDFPSGSLSFAIGAVKVEDISAELLMDLNFEYESSSISAFNISLSQTPAFDNNNLDVIQTRLNASYQLATSDVSSLSTSIQLADDNRLTRSSIDAQSVQASLSYTHRLGGDFDFVSGVSFGRDSSTRTSVRTTRTIFVGLDRTFSSRR